MVEGNSLNERKPILNAGPESMGLVRETARTIRRSTALSHTAEITDALGARVVPDEKLNQDAVDTSAESLTADVRVEVAAEDLEMSDIADRLSSVVRLEDKDRMQLRIFLQESFETRDRAPEFSDYVKIVQKIIDDYIDAIGRKFDNFEALKNNTNNQQLALLRQCTGVSIDPRTGSMKQNKGEPISAIIAGFYNEDIQAKLSLNAKIVFNSLTIFLEDSAKPARKGL